MAFTSGLAPSEGRPVDGFVHVGDRGEVDPAPVRARARRVAAVTLVRALVRAARAARAHEDLGLRLAEVEAPRVLPRERGRGEASRVVDAEPAVVGHAAEED